MTKLRYLFVLFVVLTPLPLGSNTPMAWTVCAAVAACLALGLSITGLTHKTPASVPARALLVPGVLFLLVCLWAFIQSLGLTPVALHHSLWQASGEALGLEAKGAISLNPYETRIALMRLMTYGLVFWLAVQLGRKRDGADLILQSIVVAGALYALYGLLLWSIGSTTILWYQKWINQDALTSVFVNRNHFATFAGLTAIACLGLVVRSITQATYAGGGRVKVKYRLERLLEALSGRLSFYVTAMLLVLGALLLTNSRAGFLFTGLAFIVYLGLTAIRRAMGVVGIGIMAGAALAVAIVLFDMGGQQLSIRLDQIDLGDSGRASIYARTLDAIADFPLTGTGYGTFQDVFPIYRDESVSSWGRWRQAHSSYLENMLELGLPAAFALFLSIGWAIWRCLLGALQRQRASHIPMIAFAGSVLVATHSLVDFPLQIPGVAIPYAALLGLGVAQSWSSRAWSRRGLTQAGPDSALRRAAAQKSWRES